VPTLKALSASGHEVVGVLTQPAKPQGRKRVLTQTAVSQWATSQGIPVFTPVSRTDLSAVVTQLQPDIAVVVAYGKILNADVLQSVPLGWWNVHFSLLPRWRGATPVQHTLLAGDANAGISVFKLVPELDAGPVATSASYPVQETETAGDLLSRLAEQAPGHVLDVLGQVGAGSLALTDQAGMPTYAPKLARGDGELDLTKNRLEVFRRFRAVSPEPGAFLTRSDNQTPVKVLSCRLGDEEKDLTAGSIKLAGRDVFVGTADGTLLVELLQPAGGKPMSAADWFRGLPDGVSFHVG